MPTRAHATSWATPGNYIQYTTTYTVQGISIPGLSTTNTNLTVLGVSGNSVEVRVTTSSQGATTGTLYLDRPFPATQGQLGLPFPLYCPPSNISSCANLVSIGSAGSIFGSFNPSSASPQESVSGSNTQTVAGTIRTSTLSVTESSSYNSPGGYGTINFQISETGSYDSLIGLLTAGDISISENFQYSASGQSVTYKVDSSTKMANTNINSWTPGSTPVTIPWFLWAIAAAAAIVVVVAVIALARRRGRGLTQPSPAPMATSPTVAQAKPIFCGHCGAQMDTESVFCGKCGASLN